MTTNNYKAELDLAVALHEVAVKERDLARVQLLAARKRIVELDEVRAAQGELLAQLPPSADQLVMAEMDAAVARTERDEARAEVERLRSRVGWLDHLDTPEGRAMHATEAVRVENEQLRADLREGVQLLIDSWGDVGRSWEARYDAFMTKHREAPGG